jgi:3-methyladenine DNA glycosylase/8-oxoguanine DNA glycosylase
MEEIILAHFKKVDPKLHKLAIKFAKKLQKSVSRDYFASLCESIISQQLSVKVGDVIYSRFIALLKNRVTPEEVLKHSV